ncbi:bacteriocin [Aeromonas veronii]|uniref:bacteriocin n=1 Tax=Aeromonas TaxID=642 RepID=UPI000D1113B8|nr:MULTISPECIES: bacteriocin [Aeromonas]MCJ7976781.1 bacteriocin [Aeromonas veronii]PSJ89845.1 bacteriocin [Aeromonas veronii]UOR20884.1 bacteriocin [Aeromonas veronii]
MGYGLLDIGAQTRQQGMAGLRDAANREQEVEMANQSLKTAKKQQTMSAIGAGAGVGTMVMPGLGTAIGAGIGFLADSLF